VDPLELDTALDELETRVERLRSLYEQYFMGIEKIPPAVVHKDVERRIYTLRREQIRNTAKRFKFQTTIQRYNTFQQYWQRILREIENGTYKRHVLRAERSLASTKTPLLPGAPPRESNAAELEPASENVGSGRGRKTIAPSSPRHSLPANVRHSTLPPPDKIEAFTKALERDLAAALDGDLDFGQLSLGANEESFDLGERSPQPTTLRSRVHREGRRLMPPPKPPNPAARSPLPPIQQAPAPPKAKPTKPATASGLTDEKVRRLHQDLVEAKARTADTKPVSINALTRKLENTAKQLSEKHAGKRIDFVVVIKEGKAVVRPIVR
jgi:hypothetical protein